MKNVVIIIVLMILIVVGNLAGELLLARLPIKKVV